MKKHVIALALIAIAAMSAAAANVSATIVEIAGKVEYQLPGKDWKVAKKGDALPKGTLISTGFKSTVVLKAGPSTITVKPITRLTLEEILQSDKGTQTQLFLMAGRVKAEVTPQAGQTTEFQVKSPTATASVRGTGFEFDGVNLIVEHGTVRLLSPSGMSRSVGAGEFCYIASDGSVATPGAASTGKGLDDIGGLLDQAGPDSAGFGPDRFEPEATTPSEPTPSEPTPSVPTPSEPTPTGTIQIIISYALGGCPAA